METIVNGKKVVTYGNENNLEEIHLKNVNNEIRNPTPKIKFT